MDVQNSDSLSEEEMPSLDFRHFHITDKEYTKYIFEEKLKLMDGDGNVIDEVTVSVEPGDQDDGGFEVLQYSQDKSLLLRTQSHVTRYLKTVSEVRKIKQNQTEKLLRITKFHDMYRVFMVETDLDQRTGSRFTTELPKSHGQSFVLEGANVLLLRKLALSRPLGRFTTLTVGNDGQFHDANYKVEYHSRDEVLVTRVVGSETMTTVLSLHGRIMSHEWSSSQWRLETTLPRSKKHSPNAASDLEQLGQEFESVAEPMVDLPAYWERKEEVLAQLREYMMKQSAVQDMILDLMKNILFELPEDPIDFADIFLREFLGIPMDTESVLSE